MDKEDSVIKVNIIGGVCPKEDDGPLIGGAEKAPYRIAKHLASMQDVEVKYFFFRGHPGHRSNYKLIRTLPGKLYLSTIFKELAILINWKSISSADVVQIHHPHFSLAVGLMRFFTGKSIKLIIKAHGTASPEFNSLKATGLRGFILQFNNWLHLKHDIFALKFADICICSSDFQMAEMEKIYRVDKNKLVTIYNGYDPDYYPSSGVAKIPKSILIVARPVRKKNIQYAVDLFEKIYSYDNEYSLTIVAGSKKNKEDPTSWKYVQGLIGNNKAISVYYDLDERKLAEIYTRSEMFICPSIDYESIPSVIYEAMASGCKVFSSLSWGIPEVLPSSAALSLNVNNDAELLLNSKLSLINYNHERFSYLNLVKLYKGLYV